MGSSLTEKRAMYGRVQGSMEWLTPCPAISGFPSIHFAHGFPGWIAKSDDGSALPQGQELLALPAVRPRTSGVDIYEKAFGAKKTVASGCLGKANYHGVAR